MVIPVLDAEGRVGEVYGRKIRDDLRPGTPLHLYLPGPHRAAHDLSRVRVFCRQVARNDEARRRWPQMCAFRAGKGTSMVLLSVLLSLYNPAKDLVNKVSRGKPRLSTQVDVRNQGTATIVTVRATCRRVGATVRTVRAERFAAAFDECADPREERTSILSFRPGGPHTLVPGIESSWTAQFETERLLREARNRDDQLTEEVYGRDGKATKVRAQKHRRDSLPVSRVEPNEPNANWPNSSTAQWVSTHCGPVPSPGFLGALAQARRTPEQVTLQVVVELADGRTFVTKKFQTPTVPAFSERFKAARRLALWTHVN